MSDGNWKQVRHGNKLKKQKIKGKQKDFLGEKSHGMRAKFYSVLKCYLVKNK